MALYEEFEPRPNRLITAESGYLRSAAYQPVGWFEYGPEPFAEAQQQGKPILLDIGGVWCHWCHVMDRESYENPDIATIINELYIPIKVDRDERPDIDARYQTAVHLLTGQGGWPLTVFLTPDGEPFYGGTYFPPEDHSGHMGMRSLLFRMADVYRNHRQELVNTAHAITTRVAEENLHTAKSATFDLATYQQLARGVREHFNVGQGGFSRVGPQFPHPGAIELALLQWYVTGDEQWRTIAGKTLTTMAQGGIYDQLGGGFHRYTTDVTWRVPHFEKMSYDNALLLEVYTHAYCAIGDPLFRRTAEGTLDFLLNTFTDRQRGGFYAAQDADNGIHDDGSYWTWRLADCTALLTPKEMAVIVPYFGITPQGNMPESRQNVLSIAESPEALAQRLHLPEEDVRQRLASGMKKLHDARNRRKTPGIDTTKYAGWNALLISACLEAGLLLDRPEAVETAIRAMEVLLEDAYEPDHGMYHLLHTSHGALLPGFLEDQVYTAKALLDAFAVNGNARFLETAIHLLDLCIDAFWDEDGGGFYDEAADRVTAAGTALLKQPRKSIADMPTPSANAIAALTLDRVWMLTREDRYRRYAMRTLEAFAGEAPAHDVFCAYYGLAMFYHLYPPAQAVIIGAPDDEMTQKMQRAALTTYRPGRLVAVFSPSTPSLPYTAGADGSPVAYLCAGMQCSRPITKVEEVQSQLREFGKPQLPGE